MSTYRPRCTYLVIKHQDPDEKFKQSHSESSFPRHWSCKSSRCPIYNSRINQRASILVGATEDEQIESFQKIQHNCDWLIAQWQWLSNLTSVPKRVYSEAPQIHPEAHPMRINLKLQRNKLSPVTTISEEKRHRYFANPSSKFPNPGPYKEYETMSETEEEEINTTTFHWRPWIRPGPYSMKGEKTT